MLKLIMYYATFVVTTAKDGCANGIINSISYALNNSDDNEEISRNIILYLKDNLN